MEANNFKKDWKKFYGLTEINSNAEVRIAIIIENTSATKSIFPLCDRRVSIATLDKIQSLKTYIGSKVLQVIKLSRVRTSCSSGILT